MTRRRAYSTIKREPSNTALPMTPSRSVRAKKPVRSLPSPVVGEAIFQPPSRSSASRPIVPFVVIELHGESLEHIVADEAALRPPARRAHAAERVEGHRVVPQFEAVDPDRIHDGGRHRVAGCSGGRSGCRHGDGADAPG